GAGNNRMSVRRQASSVVTGRESFWNDSQAAARKEARPFAEGTSACVKANSFAAVSVRRPLETVTFGFSCIVSYSQWWSSSGALRTTYRDHKYRFSINCWFRYPARFTRGTQPVGWD